ncbi:hypothetical protein E2C01_024238 [Portunus trituberculatus]|uniref:Uncharacterized protein n=1 Tax=Portunus trituberculatus TaxID=210409 RepID=A0A5B7ECM1_PORTR|nr:hypothetical protein [Portunus trituberculatus]
MTTTTKDFTGERVQRSPPQGTPRPTLAEPVWWLAGGCLCPSFPPPENLPALSQAPQSLLPHPAANPRTAARRTLATTRLTHTHQGYTPLEPLNKIAV